MRITAPRLAERRAETVRHVARVAGARERRALFVEGDYLPLPVVGRHASHLVAFARRHDDQWAVAMAPRLTTHLTRPPTFPVGASVWGDTTVSLPPEAPAFWHDVFGGATVEASNGVLRVADAVAACRPPPSSSRPHDP